MVARDTCACVRVRRTRHQHFLDEAWIGAIRPLRSPRRRYTRVCSPYPEHRGSKLLETMHTLGVWDTPAYAPPVSKSPHPSASEWENASLYLVECDREQNTSLYNDMVTARTSLPTYFTANQEREGAHVGSDGAKHPNLLAEVAGVPPSMHGDWRPTPHTSMAVAPPDTVLPKDIPIQVIPHETAESFSKRLYQCTKSTPDLCGTTARSLSVAATPFLRDALACYLDRFHFDDYPIDMALRYFLALEHLPTESQQIDRVLSAFAARYTACNPTVMDVDSAYLVTFALLLLHTDIFDRHARARLSKAAFVSLASPSHLEPLVLEYLYDNTSLSEFMFVRDKKSTSPMDSVESVDMNSAAAPAERERHALYKLITTGQILDLQQRRSTLYERTRFPFTYASHEWSEQDIHLTMSRAPALTVWVPQRHARRWLVPGANTMHGASKHHVRFLLSGTVRRCRGDGDMEKQASGRRRWRTWGLIVTGSALFWFKDTASLTRMANVGSRTWPLKIDEVMPLADALCVQDNVSPHLLRLRVQQRWLVLEPEQHMLTAWMDQINHIASIGACEHVWDEALWLPAGIALSCQYVPPPPPGIGAMRTGAVCHPHFMRDMYMKHVHDIFLVRAQSLLSIRQYITAQETRHAVLVREQEHSVQYAQHLGILTPLRKSTRDQIESASYELSRTLRTTQFELAFVSCRLLFLRAQQRLLESQLQHAHS